MILKAIKSACLMLILGASLSVSNISYSENTSDPTLNNLSPGQRLSALIINRECTKLLRGENFDYAAITQQIDSLPTQSDRNFAKESLEKCFVFAEQKGIRRSLFNVSSLSAQYPMGTSVSTSGRGTGNTSGPTTGTGTSMSTSGRGTGTAPGSTRGTGTSASTTGSGSSGPTSGLGSGNGSSRGTGTSGRVGTGTGTGGGRGTGTGTGGGRGTGTATGSGCTPPCEDGDICCQTGDGMACVDPSEPNHCGSCTACDACSACSASLESPITYSCQSWCTASNCETCQDGQCKGCGSSFECCQENVSGQLPFSSCVPDGTCTSCINLQDCDPDSNNCLVCNNGQCETSCEYDESCIEAIGEGICCKDEQVCNGFCCNDPDICCASNDPGSPSGCVDIQTSHAHCGACQHPCKGREICNGGQCEKVS